MRSLRRLRAAGWALAVLASHCVAAAEADYASLKARLQGGDTSLDFRALRLAYADSPAYAPNHVSSLVQRRAVEKALAAEHFSEAIPLLEKWLAQDYLNPFAHLGAVRAYAKTGDTARSQLHDAVVVGLFDSICRRDEGRSENRPCPVVSIDEEHFFLVMNGFRIDSQHGAMCQGELPCNVYEVVNRKTQAAVTVYLDISRPLRYSQTHSGAPPAPSPVPP
ncbi:MAG: DUF4919 domain-containing protein [Gammaproteobacteria bacterium]|nr:DUF4919 domain-containing protein [Gammaproteobacteria bacterium]